MRPLRLFVRLAELFYIMARIQDRWRTIPQHIEGRDEEKLLPHRALQTVTFNLHL